MPLITSGRSGAVKETLVLGSVWLKDPQNPAINARVFHGEKHHEITKKRKRTVFEPLGRKLPVVVSGDARYEQFSFKFVTVDESAFTNLMYMLETNGTLLLQTPTRYWYVQISGDFTIKEDGWPKGESITREVVVPFVEVDAA